MSCEQYQKDLDDFAGGLVASESATHFRMHLRTCPVCQGALEAKKQVYLAVDDCLRHRVNEELPAGFATRVRARVRADQEVSVRHWWGAWTGAAALTSVLLVLLLAHRWRGEAGGQTTISTPAAPVAERVATPNEKRRANEQPTYSSRMRRYEPVVRGTRAQRKNSSDAQVKAAAAIPEVIMPDGQEKAVAQLLEGLRTGKLKGEILVANQESRETQQLRISPLAIEPIELKPLEDSEQSSKQSHK